LSRNGSYVLALAFKELASDTRMVDISALDRDQVECDLKLAGCITFDNFVKVLCFPSPVHLLQEQQKSRANFSR
jgi:hypothetical protein